MSIRDRLPKKPTPSNKKCLDPSWVIEGSDTVKSLYAITLQEYDRVENLIITGDVSKVKDKRLIQATIAKLAGVHPSKIQTRREPELHDLISDLNTKLEKISELHNPKPRKTSSKTKRQLEHENAVLKKEIKEIKETEMRKIVEEFFNSNLLDDRDKMARENSRLHLEKNNLTDKVTVLQQSIKQLSQENAFLHQIKR